MLRRVLLISNDIPETHIHAHEKPIVEKDTPLQNMKKILATIFNMSYVIPFMYIENNNKMLFNYLCFYCKETFLAYEFLLKHTVIEHKVCELDSSAMPSLKLDSKVKIDISNLTCKVCFLSCATLNEIFEHLMSRHDEKCHKSYVSNRLGSEQADCLLCLKKFFRTYCVILIRRMCQLHIYAFLAVKYLPLLKYTTCTCSAVIKRKLTAEMCATNFSRP